MTTANVYFAISQPTGALPDLGPGSPGNPTNPIGTGIIVASSSTSAAQVELRVLTTTGAQNAGGGALTAAEVLKALDRLRWFIRQRGFIEGTGGPSSSPTFIIP